MSEYWKSTVSVAPTCLILALLTTPQPKYWCKHCKVFVRDTKLEKTNHDATPRHQGNLKRFLRDLHRGHEKDERDKEKAKAEVARLNGLVAGGGAAGASSSTGFGVESSYATPKAKATPAQRKQQLAQLAEMGVSIPDEFRPDMAMAGDWQVTSEHVIEGDSEKHPEAVALGVRKREREKAAEEEDEEALEAKKKRWGSAYRTHPTADDDGDLDALLSSAPRKEKGPMAKPEVDVTKSEDQEVVKEEFASVDPTMPNANSTAGAHAYEHQGALGIKSEVSDGEGEAALSSVAPLREEIVFKKRKAKNIRQK